MTIFENLTAHPITVQRTDGTVLHLMPTGHIARIRSQQRAPVYVRDVPIRVVDEVRIVGLPRPREGTLFVASAIVAQAAAAQGRCDVCAPDIYEYGLPRRKDGRVAVVRGFRMFGDMLATSRTVEA